MIRREKPTRELSVVNTFSSWCMSKLSEGRYGPPAHELVQYHECYSKLYAGSNCIERISNQTTSAESYGKRTQTNDIPGLRHT